MVVDSGSKIKQHKILGATVGVTLCFFAIMLLASLISFFDYPNYVTLYTALIGLFGFFITLWYILSDMGYVLNVSQHRNLAKTGAFYLSEEDEELPDLNLNDTHGIIENLSRNIPGLENVSYAASPDIEEKLEEIHNFLDELEKKKYL